VAASVRMFAASCCGGGYVSAADAVGGSNAAPQPRHLLEYSDLGAIVRYDEGVDAVLTKGAPAVTFELRYAEATLALVPAGRAVASDADDDQECLVTTLNDGSRWLLSASAGLDVARSETAVVFRGQGVVQLSFVPDSAALAVLCEARGTYAAGGDVHFHPAIDGAAALNFDIAWRKRGGSAELQMLSVAHHALSEADSGFKCAKGDMYWVEGDLWKLGVPAHVFAVDARFDDDYVAPGTASMDAGHLAAVSLQLDRDLERVRSETSQQAKFGAYGRLYFEGKELGRLGRLIEVADDVGNAPVAAEALRLLKARFTRWLDRDDVVFDATWGGVVSRLGYADPLQDFGNALYSDHHFQYGYFVYVAAVLKRHGVELGPAYERRVLDLVRDYANGPKGSPTHDVRFPTARYKDWFDAHSWATGLIAYDTGKSQESSSEAAHGYYAVALYGAAVGDAELANWGKLLLATEVVGAKFYWQMAPKGDFEASNVDRSIYGDAFARNRMAGAVAGTAAVATTWFGSNPEFVHGINILPVVAGLTELLLAPNYVCGQVGVLLAQLDRGKPDVAAPWRALAYADLAVVDRDGAWELAMSDLPEADFDDGATKANLLHWIATRPLSDACPTIRAHNDTWPDKGDIEVTCEANLACVAQGLSGMCCPQADGYMFGCCPVLKA